MTLDHNPALHCEARDAPVVADQDPALQFSQDEVIVFIHVPALQATPARHSDDDVEPRKVGYIPELQVMQDELDEAPETDVYVLELQLVQDVEAADDHNPALHVLQRVEEDATKEVDHVPALHLLQDPAPEADHVQTLQLIQSIFGTDVAPTTLDHVPALQN